MTTLERKANLLHDLKEMVKEIELSDSSFLLSGKLDYYSNKLTEIGRKEIEDEQAKKFDEIVEKLGLN